MPQYEWRCDACKVETTVIRSFQEYKEPPTEDEVPKSDTPCSHVWERLIGRGQTTVKGASWGPGKGYW
jgi:predicted nucleic acid-binding Zn ribbon protein